MSDNGTDARGKPCPGGIGGKSVSLGYEDTDHTDRIFLLINHIEMTS